MLGEVIPTATATVEPSRTPTPMPTLCVGDCTGDRIVTVDEIITLVNVVLGSLPLERCARGVPKAEEVDITTVIHAVVFALNGCLPREPVGHSAA